MADLNSDLRMAVDSGEVVLGIEETTRAINVSRAKLVVVSAVGNEATVSDLSHLCGIAGVRLVRFAGNSMELGAVCGKPYSVSSLAVVSPGNSKILEVEY
jgi:large subunit ribosomal protein L30e